MTAWSASGLTVWLDAEMRYLASPTDAVFAVALLTAVVPEADRLAAPCC